MEYVTILKPMTELGLKPTEVMALAVVYRHSQGGQGVWFGSRETLMAWLGCTSLKTVQVVLNSLIKKNYIQKRRVNIHGIWRVEYSVTPELEKRLVEAQNTECKNYTQSVQNLHSVGVKSTLTQCKNYTQSVQNLHTDNKDYNKDYKREDNARTRASNGKELAATRSKEGQKGEPSPAPSLKRFFLLVSDDGKEWLTAAFIGRGESDELRKRRHLDENGTEWKFVRRDNSAIYEN